MLVLIDNYDSFTYNLYQYLGEFDTEIRVFRNDAITGDDIIKLKPERIVISPGPGRPENAGNSIQIIKECAGKIPILGVCLGHQAIAAAYGAKISNAKKLFHGKYSMIEHNGKGIFAGIASPMQAARYHSLSIVPDTLPDCLEITASFAGEIMAVKHRKLDVIGLQFHPESIYTPDGIKLIKNFMEGEL